jgi:hypothetical protein
MLLEPVLPVNAMLVSVFTLAVVNHGKAVLTIFFLSNVWAMVEGCLCLSLNPYAL